MIIPMERSSSCHAQQSTLAKQAPPHSSQESRFPTPYQFSFRHSDGISLALKLQEFDWFSEENPTLKRYFWLIIALLLMSSVSFAQSSTDQAGAAKTIQPSETPALNSLLPPVELKIPAGTRIEIEVAYTVNSLDLKPGERISFRVLVPIVIDGVTVIAQGALVTARITQAKRGGHWGKAGKLAWSMEDVVAADNSHVPLAPETATRSDKLWTLETKSVNSEGAMGEGRVKGTSHSGEVAAVSIATGVLFPPLALMGGFKRGENAILREGRRFVVAVGQESTVKAPR